MRLIQGSGTGTGRRQVPTVEAGQLVAPNVISLSRFETGGTQALIRRVADVAIEAGEHLVADYLLHMCDHLADGGKLDLQMAIALSRQDDQGAALATAEARVRLIQTDGELLARQLVSGYVAFFHWFWEKPDSVGKLYENRAMTTPKSFNSRWTDWTGVVEGASKATLADWEAVFAFERVVGPWLVANAPDAFTEEGCARRLRASARVLTSDFLAGSDWSDEDKGRAYDLHRIVLDADAHAMAALLASVDPADFAPTRSFLREAVREALVCTEDYADELAALVAAKLQNAREDGVTLVSLISHDTGGSPQETHAA